MQQVVFPPCQVIILSSTHMCLILCFRNVLVYRFGGTSLDCTVVSISNGLYRILASTSDKEIGGQKIDDIMVEHFAGEFKR